MVYTEFVPSEGLIRDAAKAIAKMKTSDGEAPIGIQIYGSDPDAMVEAARMAEEADRIAGGHGCDLIDINFGCPVSKIAGRGAGSGMMKEPDKMVAITAAIVKAVHKPVTVKTRLGWDDSSKIIVPLAERLQDAGIAALTIHGRTRCQMYRGEADWTLIGEVKNNPRMRIPVIGNGDIDSPQKAQEAFDKYGVDAIMIGRAAIGRPWIFQEVRQYLDTGELLPEATLAVVAQRLASQLDDTIAWIGDERRGILHVRRHIALSFKGIPNFKETRIRLLKAETAAEIKEILGRLG